MSTSDDELLTHYVLGHLIPGKGIVMTYRYAGRRELVITATGSESEAALEKMTQRIGQLEQQVEVLNQALEKMDAELCKYKPALELGMMYVAKQEFDEALKRM